MRKRTTYAFLAIITIALGIISRFEIMLKSIPASMGDFLYATLIFLAIGTIKPQISTLKIGGLALVFCYIIETSQLINWQWLTYLRSSYLGHLVLGAGFLWTDILAYTAAIGLCIIIEHKQNPIN